MQYIRFWGAVTLAGWGKVQTKKPSLLDQFPEWWDGFMRKYKSLVLKIPKLSCLMNADAYPQKLGKKMWKT